MPRPRRYTFRLRLDGETKRQLGHLFLSEAELSMVEADWVDHEQRARCRGRAKNFAALADQLRCRQSEIALELQLSKVASWELADSLSCSIESGEFVHHADAEKALQSLHRQLVEQSHLSRGGNRALLVPGASADNEPAAGNPAPRPLLTKTSNLLGCILGTSSE